MTKKLFSLLAALLLAAVGYAQDDAPFFSENFEGSTHAFTIVNGTQTNQWHVGTATANGGSKAAYVSNDGGVTNAYTLTATSIVHMYTDVTFPASSSEKPYLILSFDWMGVGEGSYDNLSVYVVETSVTPAAGSSSGLGTALATFKGQSTWQQGEVGFPQSCAGTTKRLVFTWKNDYSGGGQPPMAVDNLALTVSSFIQGATGNLTWMLNTTGDTLTISGSGAMPDYGNFNKPPWDSYLSSIKSVVVAEGVTTIGNDAFNYCQSLTSVAIPEGVTNIGSYAFGSCIDIASVTIPSSVTTIGTAAFSGCRSLTELVALNPQPVGISSGVFNHINKSTCVLKVGTNAVSRYSAADGWKDFANIEGSGYTVSAIPNNAALGSVSGVQQQLYAEGDELNLTASPAAGYSFISWTARSSGQVISTELTLTITVTKDSLLTANFEKFAAVNLTAAGTLHSELADAATVSRLTVTGSIDARDVQFMRDSMTLLTSLDLSGATVAGYSGTAGTRYGSDEIYSVNVMPQYSFYNTKERFSKTLLTAIELPSSLTEIGGSAFSGCSGLTSVSIPEGITYISGSAFSGCSGLTSVTIPGSVTAIGSDVFAGCSSLTAIEAVAASAKYSSQDGVLFNKDKSTLVQYPTGKTGAYAIPEGVTSIGSSAFSECSGLSSVTIPDGVTSIGSYAFYECGGLTSVTIPEGVTTIGSYAFSYCSGLTAVTIPDGVTTIGSSAFSNCSSLTSLTIPSSATSIGSHAFNYCSSLTSVSIPEGVTTVGYSAFASCSDLTSVTIPSSVTTIGNYAFEYCSSLTEVVALSSQPVAITTNVFSGVNKSSCTLKVSTGSVSLYQAATGWKDFTNIVGGGYTVSAMPSNAVLGSVSGVAQPFYAEGAELTLTATPVAGCSFVSWTVRGSGQVISTEPILAITVVTDSLLTANFERVAAVDLTAAGTLRSKLTNAATVSRLTVTGSIDARDVQFMRDSMTALASLDLSGATVASYSGTAGTRYGSNVSYPANEMPQYSFYNSNNGSSKISLTAIELPSGLTGIGSYALGGCSGLSSVSIPEGVTTIGSYAFQDCIGLSSVGIPESASTIGNYAFRGCSSLSSISILSSVTTIGNSVFVGCFSLTAIEVVAENPNYSSQDGVLFNKNKTTLIQHPAGKIGAYAIPNSVTTIGSYAFYYCSDLTSVSIPSCVTAIGNSAFYNCSSLTEVVALNPQPVDITMGVFYGVNKSSCVLKVPTESVSLYKAATGWKDLTNIEGVATYTVTFNAQEGSEVAPQTLLPNSTATEPTVPTKPGYTFGGWYREAACTNVWSFATNTVTRDTTLYAQWHEILLPKYTVTITTGVNGAIVVKNGTEVVTSGATLDSGTVLTLTATPNSGYKFSKWWDNSTVANREIKLQANATISATFTEQSTPQPTTYTVTFNAQGGSSVAPQTVESGSKATQPTAPTKANNTFGGWYMEPECINRWNFNTAITSNLLLYAKWTPEGGNTTAVTAAELLPLKLYPTVTNGELKVENGEWDGVIASEAKQSQAIEVYNLSGALVAKVPTIGEITSLNVAQLPSGTYIVKVGRYVGKVVKK